MDVDNRGMCLSRGSRKGCGFARALAFQEQRRLTSATSATRLPVELGRGLWVVAGGLPQVRGGSTPRHVFEREPLSRRC